MRVRLPDSARGQAALRRQNLSAVLREVHVAGPRSRSDLAARLHLNRSTVASLVAELSHGGLVSERPPAARAMPGRPSPLVEARSDGPVVVAAEIATDALAVGVVGIGGVILGKERVERPREQDPDNTLALLAQVTADLTASLGRRTTVLAYGISVPGLVRRQDGFVHLAPNLGWRDVPFSALVRERLRLSVPVFAANDADMAALAEHTRGAGVGRRDFICLWGQAGMGAGIIVGGVPLTGRAGYAGEVGHMVVDPRGLPCHCGSRGCWETEVGEDALLRRSGRAAEPTAGEAVDRLFAAAEAGDRRAIDAIGEVGRWLGVGIAGLVDIFNPSGIALGGLYARLYPYVRDEIVAAIAERAITASRDLVEVMPAALGDDSALLGAAELALAPVLRDPTSVAPLTRAAPAA